MRKENAYQNEGEHQPAGRPGLLGKPGLPDQRTLAFDAVRIAAILAVIAIHALMSSRGADFRLDSMAEVERLLSLFAVPVLTFLSGVLVWGKPWRRGPGAYQEFLSRRLRRVGLPYLAWSAVFIGLLYLGAPGSDAILAQEYARGAAVAAGSDAVSGWDMLLRTPGYLLSGHSWYHLYFVPMVLTLYLVTPLAARLLRAFPGSAELTVLTLLALKVQAWPLLSPIVQAETGEFVWSWAVHLVQHAPHMALGAWFAIRVLPLLVLHRGASQQCSQGSAALAVGVFTPRPIAWTLALKPVATILVAAAIALVLEPLWQRIPRPLTALSRLSFGAYCAHPLILLALQQAPLDWNSWPQVSAAFAVMTLGSFGVSWALSRSARTRWLIGE